MDTTKKFCEIVRLRSKENERAIHILSRASLHGQVISVLRQELDSMVRVIFLLKQPFEVRDLLISQTLKGEKWRLVNKTNVTDRMMVELASELHGWTLSVYKFGCALIHLSQFHEYLTVDPFSTIENTEIESIKSHLNYYHGFSMGQDLTMQSISRFLPQVFEKISSNLECYLKDLENEVTDSL